MTPPRKAITEIRMIYISMDNFKGSFTSLY